MLISHKTLDSYAKLYGDAFYILDLNKFQSNSKCFIEALRSYYSNVRFAYSYKTNYIPDLAKAADDLGFYAEVVSETEYRLARRYGNPGSNIIFNGPIKTGAALETAFREGAIVNLDNLGELDELQQLLDGGVIKHAEVGIRASFDMGLERCSRFGLNVECGDFDRACERIDMDPRIDLIGLHCHFSVPQRDAASYRRRLRRLIDLAAGLSEPSRLRFLDVGGGFAGPLSPEFRKEFDIEMPEYEEYARAVAGEMSAAYPGGDGPELILEPGMGLLADTMSFVCRVHALKKSGSHRYAITTGSIFNVKPFLHGKNMPFRHVPTPRTDDSKAHDIVQLTGYTCMEIDVLYRDYKGDLREGDYLVFDNCGAYAPILIPPFIRPAPAIIEHGTEARLIRRASDETDMIAEYEN